MSKITLTKLMQWLHKNTPKVIEPTAYFVVCRCEGVFLVKIDNLRAGDLYVFGFPYMSLSMGLSTAEQNSFLEGVNKLRPIADIQIKQKMFKKGF